MAQLRLDSLSLALAALLFAPAALLAQTTVPRFDTADVALHSAVSYDGAHGTSPNPFDLAVTASVVTPDGRRIAVPGFFDGDGNGGMVGNVFRLRIYADQPGTWRYTTTSSVPGLGGLAGSFSCAGTLAGAFGSGPIVENPAHPRSFMHQEGGPVYLIGKFLDTAAHKPLQWSHVLLSESLTDADR
jgi:hypothetical protein